MILGRNVRAGRDEVDLLALDGQTLVCVEVRARRAGAMVHPLESIDARKRIRMARAARRLATEHRTPDVRIDVVAFDGDAMEHIEGAVDFSEA